MQTGRKLRNALFIICLFISWPNAFAESSSSCIYDQKIRQNSVRHHLTSQQIDLLKRLSFERNISEAWRLLGQWGDRYAFYAHKIVTPPAEGQTDLFYSVIRDHWLRTVGETYYRTLFLPVARRHFTQYLEILETGYWPDSDQILNSYLNAAYFFLLPQVGEVLVLGETDPVVFDATWAKSGIELIYPWETAVELDPARVVRPSRVCITTSSLRAFGLSLRALIGLLF